MNTWRSYMQAHTLRTSPKSDRSSDNEETSLESSLDKEMLEYEQEESKLEKVLFPSIFRGD